MNKRLDWWLAAVFTVTAIVGMVAGWKAPYVLVVIGGLNWWLRVK